MPLQEMEIEQLVIEQSTSHLFVKREKKILIIETQKGQIKSH